jgi:hypothetical protein
MRKSLLFLALCPVALTAPAAAEPWVRGFAVEKYEPAFFYGGRSGTEERGSDCPKGTIGDNDYRTLLSTKWRTEDEIAPLLVKPADDTDPSATHFALETAISYRGWRRDIETYINPFGAPDPGMQQVTGKIAEGFDLDGNTKTGGFVSPTGRQGIDNAYYRAAGCTMSYRGTPYHAYLSMRGIDKMQEGLFTIVIRMSGAKDPMNDDDVTLEIGYSPDKMAKNAIGGVNSEYSFRMVKTVQYTKVKARIKDGVLETPSLDALKIPDFAWFQANAGEALYRKGRIRLTIADDGNVSGLLGGYRDWRDVYAKDTWNQGQPEPNSATTREVFYHQNQIGMYYALKRNADGIPDPKTGRNTAISMAWRFTAVPAFVIDPKKPVAVEVPENEKNRVVMAEKLRARFMTAIATKAFQNNPFPGKLRNRKGAKPLAAADLQAPTAR